MNESKQASPNMTKLEHDLLAENERLRSENGALIQSMESRIEQTVAMEQMIIRLRSQLADKQRCLDVIQSKQRGDWEELASLVSQLAELQDALEYVDSYLDEEDCETVREVVSNALARTDGGE